MQRHGSALALLALLLQMSCALGSIFGTLSYIMENTIPEISEETGGFKSEVKLKENSAYPVDPLFHPVDRTSDEKAVDHVPHTHKVYPPGSKKSVGHVETNPPVYDKGIIKIVHKGWFVTHWEITWEEVHYDAKGNPSTIKKAWDGNDKDITAPFSREIEIPHNAQAIHVVAKEFTLWATQFWRVVFDRTDIPFMPERTFTVWGTTLSPQYNIHPPLK